MAACNSLFSSNIVQITACVAYQSDCLLYQPGNITSLAVQVSILLEDADLRTSLGDNARQKAIATHSWAINAQSVTELIKRYQSQAPNQPNLVTIGGNF